MGLPARKNWQRVLCLLLGGLIGVAIGYFRLHPWRIPSSLDDLKGRLEWKGMYLSGPEAGSQYRLYLDSSGYVAITHSGCGPLATTYWTTFNFTSPADLTIDPPSFVKGERPSDRFLALRWGDRHYILASDALLSFANSVNSGAEPRSTSHGDCYLRTEDESRPVTSSPPLPPEYLKMLLKLPVEGKIVAATNPDDVAIRIAESSALQIGHKLYGKGISGERYILDVVRADGSNVHAKVSFGRLRANQAGERVSTQLVDGVDPLAELHSRFEATRRKCGVEASMESHQSQVGATATDARGAANSASPSAFHQRNTQH